MVGTPEPVAVRAATPADGATVAAFLDRHGMRVAARRGELVDTARHPSLLAERGGRVVGVLVYVPGDVELEILALYADERRGGIGTALIEAVVAIARDAGARRLWLITTNDNLDALRFYQRRGFRLVGVDAGAVDRSRAARKPSIPETGEYGIPIRDELELERPIERPMR